MDDNISPEELLRIIPELEIMVGYDQKHPHHHLDLWDHTLYALSLSNKDFDVRLALTLHDIGKPYVAIEQDGVRHFPNHGEVSAKISNLILRRLGFNSDYTRRICYLIENHDNRITEDMLDNALIDKLYEIQRCDALAHHPDKLEKRINYLEETKKLIKSKK
jgi:tRNA nucleotidyltransferase (CCA-adding enzyme)